MQKLLTATLVTLSYVSSALATQPPDVVASDDRSNTAMGTGALRNLSDGIGNSAVGTNALQTLTDGNYNTAVGTFSLAATTGHDNTALGVYAAGRLANGSQNTAVGSYALIDPNFGAFDDNTVVGYHSMYNNYSGSDNTAMGSQALQNSIGATGNTAIGKYALYGDASGTMGDFNTAVGISALMANEAGTYNTAVGQNAMSSNTSGNYNVAVGAQSLLSNTSGTYNTALGYLAMFHNTTGHDNVAIGEETLWANTIGQQNMAVGRSAMRNSTTGSFNAVQGYASCWSCRSANQNTGYGFKTFYNLNSGTSNVAFGYQAGYNLTGSNNIDIANSGVAGESGVIRIGAPSVQTQAFIAGILGNAMTGATVVINANGQLGVASSSRRYKTDIESMQSLSRKLGQLRPVTFHMKQDPHAPLQYGLIAEEVDKVFPELVIRDQDGGIQGVRYDELTPLLLKQSQELAAALATQRKTLDETCGAMLQMKNEIAELRQQNSDMHAELSSNGSNAAHGRLP